MLEVLQRIHWDEFFKSKSVWSGILGFISGILAMTGHAIDPQQQNAIVTALTQISSGLVEIFAVGTVIFRATAKTAIIAPPAPDLPVIGAESLPVTKAEAKATLQGLTAGTVVTPAQEAAAVQIVPQSLTTKEKP